MLSTEPAIFTTDRRKARLSAHITEPVETDSPRATTSVPGILLRRSRLVVDPQKLPDYALAINVCVEPIGERSNLAECGLTLRVSGSTYLLTVPDEQQRGNTVAVLASIRRATKPGRWNIVKLDGRIAFPSLRELREFEKKASGS